MNITAHAQLRLQQRGLSPLVIDLLHQYGRAQYQNGSSILFFDARGRAQALAALRDAVQRFDTLGNAYLIEANDSGAIVTVGHRRQRIKAR